MERRDVRHAADNRSERRRATFSPLEQLRAVRDLRGLSSTAKAVLQALITRADENGRCYPSYAKIAKDAGVTARCAKAVVKRLVALDHLSRTTQRVQGQMEYATNAYTVHVHAEVVNNDHQVVNDVHHGGEPGSRPVVNQDHRGGDLRSPKLPIELPNGTISLPLTWERARASGRKSKTNGKTTTPPSSVTPSELASWCALWAIPNPEADGEVARFVDHARANDRRCADWGAAWRNWKRKAPTFGPGPRAVRHSVQPPAPAGKAAWVAGRSS